MHKRLKRLYALLLAVAIWMGLMPGTHTPAHAGLEDEFRYPKFSYSDTAGMTSTVIAMKDVKYLVYTFSKSGTLTVNGTYIADIWLAGGGANGGTANRNTPDCYNGNFGYGGGGGYTTNAYGVTMRSGAITIGQGGGGTTSYVYPDPVNPGQNKTLTAAGGSGVDGGSGGGSFEGGKGQGSSTRPFAAAEMPAYCQGGGSQGYVYLGSTGAGYSGLPGGSDGGNGASHKTQTPEGTGGVGGATPQISDEWPTGAGHNATGFGGGGGGGNPGGKGYQGAVMVRIPLTSLLPADYAVVDNAIQWANSLPKDQYEDFSAVEAAIAAVDRTKVASEQADVHAMAQAITNAVNSLKSRGADYTLVNDLTTYVLGLNPAHYEDFSAVLSALAAVDRNKTVEQQAEVNAMAKAIYNAVNALVPLPADYSAVDAALAAVDKLLDPGYYVSFDGVNAAIQSVVRGKGKAQQAEVDAMAKALTTAVNSLQVRPANYDVVDAAILRAAQLNAYDYTNFNTVIDAAKAVDRTKTLLEQIQVDQMAARLQEAIDGLTLKAANYEAVDMAIRYAQGLDPRNYTNFETLSEALRAVDKTKTIKEQADVDKMATDIVQAILDLQSVAPTPTPTATPDTSVTPTPTPNGSGSTKPTPTLTPTPTPYNHGAPGKSNGITLDQLQALLNKAQATPTPTPIFTLTMPRTGDGGGEAWVYYLAIGLGLFAVATIIVMQIKRKKGK